MQRRSATARETSLLHDQFAMHEPVPGTAQFRAFERVPARALGRKSHVDGATTSFWNNPIDVSADDAEPVVGVVAFEVKFHRSAQPDPDLVRRKPKSFGND